METFLVIWAIILFFWSWLNLAETRESLELTEQARETAEDNLRLFSNRNELRAVSFIMRGGNVKTYSARGYKRKGGYFSVYDKDGNLVIELSEKDVKEVRLTRATEYTYLNPELIIGNYYVRSGISQDDFTELKNWRGAE